ncbi:hypothetical protein OSTOST_17785 [Ostertagia ostertagi]
MVSITHNYCIVRSGSRFSLASYLLDYYTGTNCGDWIESLATSSSKTKALDAYANIIQYLSTKYRSQPMRILSICKLLIHSYIRHEM